jgi:hypothetical protein
LAFGGGVVVDQHLAGFNALFPLGFAVVGEAFGQVLKQAQGTFLADVGSQGDFGLVILQILIKQNFTTKAPRHQGRLNLGLIKTKHEICVSSSISQPIKFTVLKYSSFNDLGVLVPWW